MSEELIRIENLKKEYVIKSSLLGKPKQVLRALNGVSLTIAKGESLGVVGESGCGKTTLGRTVLRLIEPTSGKILYRGRDITALPKEELRQLRKKLQIIFQDPYASLNPRATVRELIRGPLDAFEEGTKEEREERVVEMARLCGLDPQYLNRYPNEFSGGQRQRIVIARALILKPEFVVCDEPVSALDVSVRSQILNLMKDLQKELGLTSIFISHDLSVVKYISSRIAVMYLGQVVELARKEDLYEEPLHPYSQALFSAIPIADVRHIVYRRPLKGDVPSPINPPSGCVFHTRCPYATDRCVQTAPQLACMNGETGHYCACHHPDLLSRRGDFI